MLKKISAKLREWAEEHYYSISGMLLEWLMVLLFIIAAALVMWMGLSTCS